MKWIYFCDDERCRNIGGHICHTPIELYELINEQGESEYKFGEIKQID